LSDIPIGIGDKAVQTGLVRRMGKFAVDPRHVFALGDESRPARTLGKLGRLAPCLIF
jgi:hypothetical protein